MIYNDNVLSVANLVRDVEILILDELDFNGCLACSQCGGKSDNMIYNDISKSVANLARDVEILKLDKEDFNGCFACSQFDG